MFIVGMMTPVRAVPTVQGASSGDPIPFCKAHPDMDKPGPLPAQIARLDDQLLWRCMDGQVLVCSDSADGDWCSKKDARRMPSAMLTQACRDEPQKASFDFAEEHYSAFDWRCANGVPVIARSYAMDHRQFFKASWTRLIVRNGIVTGPTEFPSGPR